MSLAALLAIAAACAAWFLPALQPASLAVWANSAAAHSPPADAERNSDEGEPELVALASADLARQIGIETAEAVVERHAHHLTCNAETAFAGRRSAEVLARVDGVVRDVRVELSQVVKRGDVLAVIDSATVGSAKTQYRTALANLDLAQTTYDRIRKLAEREILAGKSELEAATALTAAKNNLLEAEQRLRNLGFQSDDLAKIADEKSADNLWEVVAPIDGHVIAWDATIGEAVSPATQLFGLADITRMWLWIDVYESDIDAIRIGQPASFRISGTHELVFDGKITAIGAEVNRITRTTRVRAELTNPEERLRANQFGQAKIEIVPEHESVVVPAAAVQRDQRNRELVFLPEGASAFRPRAVASTPTDDPDRLEIASGLQAGETVVTTGAFLLLSEMHKDQIAEDVD